MARARRNLKKGRKMLKRFYTKPKKRRRHEEICDGFPAPFALGPKIGERPKWEDRAKGGAWKRKMTAERSSAR